MLLKRRLKKDKKDWEHALTDIDQQKATKKPKTQTNKDVWAIQIKNDPWTEENKMTGWS